MSATSDTVEHPASRASRMRFAGDHDEGRGRLQAGWTLLEVTLSLAILSFLTVAVIGVSSETAQALARSESASHGERDVLRILARVAEITRKSIRRTVDGVAYPRASSNGAELELLLPAADGLDAVDLLASTARASEEVFRIRIDPSRALILARGEETVWRLGGPLDRVHFVEANEAGDAFRITLEIVRDEHVAARSDVSGVVTLRQPRRQEWREDWR